VPRGLLQALRQGHRQVGVLQVRNVATLGRGQELAGPALLHCRHVPRHSYGRTCHEILAGEGDLVDWAKRLPGSFWFDDSAESVQHMTDLVMWAREDGRPYTDAAVEEFLRSADLRLIALAKAIGAAVAPREVAAPRSTKKVKIPDACQAIGVTCVTPFQAYRAAGMCLS